MEPPAELKSITPFLQRAQELKSRDAIVSYYCTYYAVQQAIQVPNMSKDAQLFLVQLVDQLEKVWFRNIYKKEKEALKDQEPIVSDIAGYEYVSAFALKIFLNADNEDRAGLASKYSLIDLIL